MPVRSSDAAPRRVLVVAPQPVYEDRGTPIAICHVLKALTELGFQVDVLTYPLGRDIPIEGVRWIRVANPLRFRHVPIGLSFPKIVLDVLIAFRLIRLLRAVRYDYVHAVEEAAYFTAPLCRSRRIPLLYDMQSSIPQQLARHAILGRLPSQWLLCRFERWLLKRADLVVASLGLAEYVKRQAPTVRVEEWHYPGAPPALRANLPPKELRSRLAIPDGAKTVVYSGTFEEYQGLDSLVHAARRVIDTHPETFFIALGGDRRSVSELEERVERAGLTRQFRILDRQPRDVALAFIHMADVVVSPRAQGDNLPLKIIDYMAAAKPIVATRIAAHLSVLDSSRAILTDLDPASLAQGIVTALDDEGAAARLAAQAKEYNDSHLGGAAFRGYVRQYSEQVMRGRSPLSIQRGPLAGKSAGPATEPAAQPSQRLAVGNGGYVRPNEAGEEKS